MNIKTTVVYEQIEEARLWGFSTISCQGSSRSSKTYNILIWLILHAVSHPNTRISIVRKTLPALKASAYYDFKEILLAWKWWSEKRINKSDLIYTFPNGSTIEFFSTDSEEKLRGRKQHILYANEANELDYLEWQQLKFRTSEMAILDYNPSFDEDHWVSTLNKRDDVYHFITTYKDNPFLGRVIIDELESLQHTNQSLWKIYGLGQQAIVEGLIFPSWQRVDEFPAAAKREGVGIDFGYTNDPTAIIRCGLLGNNLYFEEMNYATRMTTNDIADALKVRRQLNAYADNSDPRLIDEIRMQGVRIEGVAKPKIIQRINSMQKYNICIVKGSPAIESEIKKYTYVQDRSGKWLNEPIDKFNHAFDAAGYWYVKNVMGVGQNKTKMSC